MKKIDLQFLYAEGSLKEALQRLLGCSGQLMKKFFSSKDLAKSIQARELISLPLEFVNHLKINPHYAGPALKILEDNIDFIAVHKPSGLHSHPHSYLDTDTVLNYLQSQNFHGGLNIQLNHYDRGLLFRLDFETSGIMIVAKEQAFFDLMRGDFSQQMKKKIYLAIVEGDFNLEGEWTHYFLASGKKGAVQKVYDSSKAEAQRGIFKVKKLLHSEGKSLLLIELKTGLRHQIRAQLAHLGFPILGDTLYGGVKAERLFLHAWRYEWDQVIEDRYADLFESFFDLNRGFQVAHDMLRTL